MRERRYFKIEMPTLLAVEEARCVPRRWSWLAWWLGELGDCLVLNLIMMRRHVSGRRLASKYTTLFFINRVCTCCLLPYPWVQCLAECVELDWSFVCLAVINYRLRFRRMRFAQESAKGGHYAKAAVQATAKFCVAPS